MKIRYRTPQEEAKAIDLTSGAGHKPSDPCPSGSQSIFYFLEAPPAEAIEEEHTSI
jgi:hypothetical protein